MKQWLVWSSEVCKLSALTSRLAVGGRLPPELATPDIDGSAQVHMSWLAGVPSADEFAGMRCSSGARAETLI